MFDIVCMTEEDIADVLEVEQKSFPKPWSEASFKNELENDKAVYLVCRSKEKKAIAYGGFWLVCGEAQITNIAVHPEFRECGVGSSLLGRMIEEAQAKAACEMTLEVRVGNEPAKKLYRRFGFEEVGIRKRYYHDGEDALLMMKKLG